MPHPTAAAQRDLALSVLRRLREAGYQALWAGGCVRDQLLGRTPKDYDVATDATPEQIRALFGRRHTLAIGAAFGVVAVLGPKHVGMIEVTTFRRDAEYSDGRHPDAVVFSTPEEDAQRRDFTINGLFYDPLDDRVIDYVGGQADLERRVVRAIGDPRARFTEDKLRMVRAVRFAAGFDFALDEPTLAAIDEMAETIQVVSPERIAQEMRKMLVDPQRAAAVELLRRTRLLAVLLPELDELASSDEAPTWQHTKQVLTGLVAPSFSAALAALLHALDEPAADVSSADQATKPSPAVQVASAIGDRWRLSNKERDLAQWLLANHARLKNAAGQRWSDVQPLLIDVGAAELVALHEAEGLSRGGDHALAANNDVQFCRAKLALPPAELDPPALLDGNDLFGHGIPRGAIYRYLLSQVRAAQLDGQISTRAEALSLVDRLRNDGH
jgi:poly(A) polymerase